MGNPISGQSKGPALGQYLGRIALAGIRVQRDDDADTLNLSTLLTMGLYGGRFPGGSVLIATPAPAAAAGALPIPWQPFFTQDNSGNYQANFYPGTVGGILPAGITGIALTQGQVNYVYLAMTAGAGRVTGATPTASTTYPSLAASASGSPPTAFNIPLGIFDLTQSPPKSFNIVGFGNIWCQPFVTLFTTINTGSLLQAPFTPSYNWEWGGGQ